MNRIFIFLHIFISVLVVLDKFFNEYEKYKSYQLFLIFPTMYLKLSICISPRYKCTRHISF